MLDSECSEGIKPGIVLPGEGERRQRQGCGGGAGEPAAAVVAWKRNNVLLGFIGLSSLSPAIGEQSTV